MDEYSNSKNNKEMEKEKRISAKKGHYYGKAKHKGCFKMISKFTNDVKIPLIQQFT